MLFINYMEVHAKYGRTPGSGRWLGQGVTKEQALAVNQDWSGCSTGETPLSPDDFGMLRDLYDGDMTYLDMRIGQLIRHLKDLKIEDETIVIVTSDHGEEFGEHNLLGHVFCLYNTLLHVPLIVRYPRLFDAGSRLKTPVQTTDIFPTILDALQIDWDGRKRLNGRSLLNHVGEKRHIIAEHNVLIDMLTDVITRHPKVDVSRFIRRLRSIQSGRFKYIWSSDGRDELYDIAGDPKETKNLIAASPMIARRLETALRVELGALSRDSSLEPGAR